MKIYIVTKGSYSDYHIITATTDEKLAYEIKDKFSRNSSYEPANVEVFENAEIYLKTCYYLEFDPYGDLEKCERRDSEYYYDEVLNTDSQGNIFIYVVADSAEAAIKIGSERRAMYLAKEAGVC